MADNPLKVIPPKLAKIGKSIKVRVFSVNPNGRKEKDLVLTKKDTFLKDEGKIKIWNNPEDLKKGDKVIGVAVGKTEHGFIIKSFGEVKGLLTFADLKENSKGVEVKIGSTVKAYVLFNKKNKGVALTLSKKKVKQSTEV